MPFCPNCGTQYDNCRFCKNCGQKLDAPSPAKSTSSVSASVSTANVPPNRICPVCKKPAGDLLDKLVNKQHYHLNCFNCSSCGKYLSGTFSMPDPRDLSLIICPDCKGKYESHYTPKSFEEGGSYVIKKVNMNVGREDICAKCGKKVYDSERMRAMERVWHYNCFRCFKCNGKLSSFEVYNNDPYCRNCYLSIINEGKSVVNEAQN